MIVRRLLVLVVALSLALAGLAAPAGAARPIDVEDGAWTYVPDDLTPEPDKVVGQNVFISNSATGTWTATTLLAGDVTEDFVVVIHKGLHGTYQGLVTFEGVVDGKEGTLQIKTNGSGPWPPNPEPEGDWSGSWVILSGTDDLSNLRGQGSWWGPLGNLLFDGKVHFTG